MPRSLSPSLSLFHTLLLFIFSFLDSLVPLAFRNLLVLLQNEIFRPKFFFIPLFLLFNFVFALCWLGFYYMRFCRYSFHCYLSTQTVGMYVCVCVGVCARLDCERYTKRWSWNFSLLKRAHHLRTFCLYLNMLMCSKYKTHTHNSRMGFNRFAKCISCCWCCCWFSLTSALFGALICFKVHSEGYRVS